MTCHTLIFLTTPFAGESVPVMKTTLPLGDEEYNHTKHKKYTLFGGVYVCFDYLNAHT